MEEIKKQSINKSLIARIAIIVVFVLLLTLFILGLSFPRGMFSMSGYKALWINNTGSMAPYLQNRDIALINQDVDFYRVEVGDIVAFSSRSVLENGEIKEIYVVHQVVSRQYHPTTGQLSFITSGTQEGLTADPHLLTQDGYNYTNTFIGSFASRRRGLGRFISFISSAAGIFMLGLNMFACLAAFVAIKVLCKDETIKKEFDSKKYKKKIDKEKRRLEAVQQ